MTLRTIVNGTLSDASDVNQYKALAQGGNVYDAKNGYGALGDGATDDTTAIQAAITAANAATYGGVVWLPPGNYKCSSTLTGKSKVTLWGAGIGITTLTLSPASGTGLVLNPAASVRPISLRVEAMRSGPGMRGRGPRVSPSSSAIWDPTRATASASRTCTPTPS